MERLRGRSRSRRRSEVGDGTARETACKFLRIKRVPWARGAAGAAMAVLLGTAPHAHSQKSPVSPPNSQKSPVPSAKPSPPPTRTPKRSTMSKTAEFAALRSEYLKGFLERFPVVATYLGAEGLDPAYAALDGRLRDYSPAALHAERDSWTGFQARLAKIEVKALPEPDRIDASVMDSQLAFLVHNLDRRVHEKALDVFVEEPLRGAEWKLQGMTREPAVPAGRRPGGRPSRRAPPPCPHTSERPSRTFGAAPRATRFPTGVSSRPRSTRPNRRQCISRKPFPRKPRRGAPTSTPRREPPLRPRARPRQRRSGISARVSSTFSSSPTEKR